jgi:hypothetical protein
MCKDGDDIAINYITCGRYTIAAADNSYDQAGGRWGLSLRARVVDGSR